VELGCRQTVFTEYYNFDMLLWNFRAYVSASGRTDIQNTIDRYDEYARAAFQRAVAHLAVTPKNEWQEPQAKKLKGKEPLFEIRFKANRCATRALGFFDDSNGIFTITLICTHKQNVYKPNDALTTAQNRAKQVGDGIASAVPLKINGEDFPSNEA
jgi:hypothetical protein